MPFTTAQIVCRSILCCIMVTHDRPKTKARSAYSESPDDVAAVPAAESPSAWRMSSRIEITTPIQTDVRTDFNNTPVNNAYFVPS